MSKELRQIHAETLIELAQQYDNIRVLEADLSGSMATRHFAEAFPERFIQCGIAEANMVGVAAGLSATGMVPFIHSFGCFATRRCYDQLFLCGGYARQHINIVGSDPGVSASHNGGTHMPFEDIGLMRLLPDARIIEASDQFVLKKALKFAFHTPGVNYIRCVRKTLPDIYQSENDIIIGRGNLLADGDDLTIVASGLCVHDTLKAAETIRQYSGRKIAVIDMHTIKPLDTDLLISMVTKSKRLLTVENHNIVGGLGEAVISALAEAEAMPARFSRMGVREQYGQVGDVDYLKKQYQLSVPDIVAEGLRLLD